MRAFYFQLYILSGKKKERKKRQKRVMLPQPCCRPVRGLQCKAARTCKRTCSHTEAQTPAGVHTPKKKKKKEVK